MSFSPQVLKYAPWSLSKAEVLGRCPSQFHLKYVLKHPETRKGTQALVGVSAHAIQEFALLRTPSQDVLTAYAKERMGEDALTDAEKTEVAGKLPGIMDFVRRVADIKERYGVQEEYVEKQLAMTAGFTGCPFNSPLALMRGVLDYGIVTQAGVLLLVDHKSGKRKQIEQHSPQFYVYMALAIATRSDLLGVQCAINYFGSPELDWFPTFSGRSGPWSREDIVKHVHPWLERYLNKLASPIKLIEDGTQKPLVGWQCDWCGFNTPDLCPEGVQHSEERKAKKRDKHTSV